MLDATRSQVFQRLTRLAANGLKAPVACFGVLDDDREIVCSAVGLAQPPSGRRSFPLDRSIAQTAVLAGRPLLLPDARVYPTLQGVALDGGSIAVACAAAPIFVASWAVGALWVVMHEERAWSANDVDMLVDLAACVQREVARAIAGENGEVVAPSSRAPGISHDAAPGSRGVDGVSLYATLVTSIPHAAIAIFDRDLRCIAIDGALARANPDRAALIGKPMPALAGLEVGDPHFAPVETLFRGALEGQEGTLDYRLADGSQTFELHVAPVEGPRGGIVGGSVLVMDKTLERAVAASLARSELLHRSVVENLPNGAVFMVDRDLRIVTAGGGIVDDILKHSQRATLAGTSALELSDGIRESMVSVFRVTLAGARAHGEVQREDRWFEMTSVPVVQGEEVTHAVLFLYDVTARRNETHELRRTQDLLARERVLLAATLEHIQDGVALRDAQGAIVFANRRFIEMFQMRPEEVDGMPRERYLARVAALAADPEGLLQRIKSAGEGLVPTMEVVLARPRRRVLRRTETTVDFPRGAGSTLVTWRDVTAEHDSLQRLRQVLERAPVGVALVSRGDPDPELHLNERGRGILGEANAGSITHEGLMHWPDGTIVTRERAPTARTLRGEEVELMEVYLARPDGGRTPLQVRGAPLFSDDGTAIGGVVVFEDVTGQKDAERLRAEWNALIAHDLRTPLNHIGLLAQMLARRAPEPFRESAREILAAVARLSRMVRDLLDLSRLEARNLALERAPGRIEHAVRQAVERATLTVDDARLTMTVEGAPPSVNFDADRLAQVLDNLLSNALKYGAREAPIDVAVRTRPAGVEVAVTNGGPGLTPDALRQLFHRFRRAPQGSHREVQGVGLGLYIARELVEAHGGTMQAESGGGRTTFRFVLPAAGGQPGTHRFTLPRAELPTRR